MAAKWIADDTPNARFGTYTRGNVGEVFPEVVTPLSWTLLGPDAEAGWRSAWRTFGSYRERDLAGERMGILGCFGGYAYLNASYIRVFAVRTPGLTVEDLDRQFFGASDAPPYVPQKGDKDLVASLRIGRSLVGTLFAKQLPELERDKAFVAQWLTQQPDLGTATDDELLRALHTYHQPYRRLFDHHILTTFRATVGRGLVAKTCEQVLGDAAHANQLLVGLGDVESAEPSQKMWELSRLDPGSPAWDAALAAFVDRYGCRGPNEWETASPTWGTEPLLVERAVELMRGADDGREPANQRRELAAGREAAVAALRAQLSRGARAQFDVALRSAALFSQARERSKTTVIRFVHALRLLKLELARRARDRGGPEDLADMWLLTADELPAYLQHPASFAGEQAERGALRDDLAAKVPPFVFDRVQSDPSTWVRRDEVDVPTGARELVGIAGSPGRATGRARVVLDPLDPRDLGPGDVLVAPITDPAWTPLFVPSCGVVVEVGAEMSHAVIVARELGIPAVVSAAGATRVIPEGALVEVDGNAGKVRILD